VGCLLIGAAAAAAETRQLLVPEARLFLMVGVLGGFTTFSTFGYETMDLLRAGSTRLAAVNVTTNVLVGLVALGRQPRLARTPPRQVRPQVLLASGESASGAPGSPTRAARASPVPSLAPDWFPEDSNFKLPDP